jgi:5-methylcytosine-specific restriction endonuclease McrA
MEANKTKTTVNFTPNDLGGYDHPSSAWPTDRTRALVRLWNSGLSAADVAVALETTVRAVECKVHKLRAAGHAIATRRRRPPSEPKKAPRKCLYCGGMFASTHIGNRLCPPCLEEGPFTGTLL